MSRWWILALLVACKGDEKDDAGTGDADADTDADTDTDVAGTDEDGDGYPTPEDCDDSDDAINPGADEVCDGVDNDCEGTLDLSPVAPLYYADFDGDGYGDPEDAVGSCFPVAERVEDATDCDDAEFDVNPGHVEWCNERDDDCNPATPDDGAISLGTLGLYASIQDAIDTAVNGDTVDVCAGTYNEPLITSKAITLLGRGRDVTFIDTAGNAPVLRILGGALIRVEGLTLANGYGDYGGCISSAIGELEVASSRLSGCTAAQGGAIFFEGSRVTLTDTELLDCEASGEGGALYAGFNSEVWMFGGRVEGNNAQNGGGGYGEQSADFEFDGVVVTGNSASELGGGFALLEGSTLSFTGGELTSNTADFGGAAFLLDSSFTTSGADLGAGLTDNAPDDVFQQDTATGFSWDGVIDVACAPSVACTP